MYKQSMQQILRSFIVIAAIVCVCLFLKFAVIYLYPFLIAILLSLLLNPAVTFLEKKIKLPRTLAALIVILSVFMIIIGSIVLIIGELIQGTTYLAHKIPSFFHTFVTYVENFLNTTIIPFYHKVTSFFHTLEPIQQETIGENIKQLVNQISASGSELVQGLLLKIPTALSILPSSMTVFTLIVLATFFITKDWNSMQLKIKKIIPSFANDSGKNVWNHLKKALFGFVKAQLILIMITAVTIFVGLLILQIDHALTIALIAAAVDLFPYIGTGIIFVPWIIYLFMTSNYTLTISLSLLYMLIIVGRQLLEPKILSSTIGLNPLLALMALFLGLQLWGFFGLIIAPILVVLLSAFHQSGLFKQLWIFIKG